MINETWSTLEEILLCFRPMLYSDIEFDFCYFYNLIITGIWREQWVAWEYLRMK